MKKKILTGAVIAFSALAAHADVPESFKQFRDQILSDYDEFRSTILSHYADFLDGVWHEYEALEPLHRDSTPKPTLAPQYTSNKTDKAAFLLPTPNLPDVPLLSRRPSTDPEKKSTGPTSFFDLPPMEKPAEAGEEVSKRTRLNTELGVSLINVSANLPEKVKMALPAGATVENVTAEEQPQEEDTYYDIVKFYDMDIKVPYAGFRISQALGAIEDLSDHWKILEDQEVGSLMEETVIPKIKELGLNDYLTYEFLCAYVDSKFPKAAGAPKASAVHYMLTNMGYDARLAMLPDLGMAVVLLPTEQNLYEKPYMEYGGVPYYVMTREPIRISNQRIVTCMLPNTRCGKKFDMRIKGLNLPMKARPFEVTYGNMTLKGSLNENMMSVVYRYPQIQMSGYAESVLDKNLRDDLVDQVKQQISHKNTLDAVEDLLHFTQHGFDYATDGEFHGFEKPYFLEENFFYAKNDCEDRALFYTYLLWNALGVESHLLNYPGHESSAVNVPDAKIFGTYYDYKGKPFYISDPTYINASTGQCMDVYQNTAPVIDHFLPNK